jgi:hypothetical protein
VTEVENFDLTPKESHVLDIVLRENEGSTKNFVEVMERKPSATSQYKISKTDCSEIEVI